MKPESAQGTPLKAITLRARTVAVLEYNHIPVSRRTVRYHYAKWREAQGLPIRCDNEACLFHTQPNGTRLRPILDHKNGNRLDNRPGNLWYLCPNCDSQQKTRGGLNRGRVVETAEGKYTLSDRESGRLAFHIVTRTGHYKYEGAPIGPSP